MKTVFIVLPLLLVMMVSCRPAAADEVPATFDAGAENGLAVGTITFEGDVPRNDIYRFFYEPTEGDKKFIKQNDGKIEIRTRVKSERAYSGDFNNSKTYLFIINRPPGKYAFTQYNYLDHIGYTGMVNNSKEFAIPFEIKKGEIAYIGELTYAENATPGSPRIFIADEFNRDVEEFRKKFSGINWNIATDKTVTSGDTGGGTIYFFKAKN